MFRAHQPSNSLATNILHAFKNSVCVAAFSSPLRRQLLCRITAAVMLPPAFSSATVVVQIQTVAVSAQRAAGVKAVTAKQSVSLKQHT
mmetsp:Transcript_5355/g.11256  ORF Transcript_5355/g.11256 Transcript_5355/m.11256 type:complete len:88 (-) Transcript_5355:328-591(-)